MTLPFEDWSRTTGAADQEAPALPFWGDSPESWDTVTIAGTRLPGICTVEGKIGRRTDKKNTAGSHGAKVTYTGDDCAEFTITIRLWTAEQLKAYAQLLDAMRTFIVSSEEVRRADLSVAQLERLVDARQAGAKDGSKFPRVPVDVVHPVLTLHRIRSAHVLEYTFPRARDAASGIYEATMRFMEFVAGKTGVVQTPKAALDITKRYGRGALGDAITRPVKPSAVNGARP